MRGAKINKNTAEAGRKYRKGEINCVDYLDTYYQSYGFAGNADYEKAARIAFMKMLTLKVNHPYYSAGYSKQYQVDLVIKYQDAEVDLKCECCGEIKDIHFMTTDHLDNNGAEQSREIGDAGGVLIRYTLRYGFNPKYRLGIMCADCNLSLGFYGFCPHHPEIIRELKKSERKRLNPKSPQNTSDSLKPRLYNLMEG